jgi:hypothetical protein
MDTQPTIAEPKTVETRRAIAMAGGSMPTATSGHDETWDAPRQGVVQEAAILLVGIARVALAETLPE